MTDVRLYHTADGGEIDFSDNGTYVEVLLDTGLETAAYLSLFGGNTRDPGIEDDDDGQGVHPHAQQWWGNIDELPTRQMRSETAYALQSVPAVSSNLIRVEQAAQRDLQWFVDEGIAQEFNVDTTLIDVDHVQIQVRFAVSNTEFVYAFTALWGN